MNARESLCQGNKIKSYIVATYPLLSETLGCITVKFCHCCFDESKLMTSQGSEVLKFERCQQKACFLQRSTSPPSRNVTPDLSADSAEQRHSTLETIDKNLPKKRYSAKKHSSSSSVQKETGCEEESSLLKLHRLKSRSGH